MIKNTVILGMLLLITTASFSQRGERKKEMMEKLEAKKIAFITTELDLSVEEAKDFWPVYDEYHEKMKAMHDEQRDLRPKVDPEELTDAEAKQLIESRLTFEEKEIALRREYVNKMGTTIPMKKVAKLLMVEREFKQKMMERIRRKFKHGDKPFPGPDERMRKREGRF